MGTLMIQVADSFSCWARLWSSVTERLMEDCRGPLERSQSLRSDLSWQSLAAQTCLWSAVPM
jgi:hypothetical protein